MTVAARFVPDHRFQGAPRLPTDRPPTRGEVWRHVTHWYSDIKSEAEMKDHAAACWTGNYIFWVNFKDWRKQPDWKEGDPVIAAACPVGPIFPDEGARKVRELQAIATEAA